MLPRLVDLAVATSR